MSEQTIAIDERAEEIAAALHDELGHDGRAEVMRHGSLWRLTVTGDEYQTALDYINECDASIYGRVAWAEPRRPWADHPPARPADFDGAARKLHPRGWHTDEPVWWQPPADVGMVDTDGRVDYDELEAAVTRLLAEGLFVVKIERCDADDVDAYGRPVVRDVATLSGIDAAPEDEYMRVVIADLAWEILARADATR